MAQGKPIPAAGREDAHLSTFKAELLFKQFDWRCTRNGYRWENVSTIQPVSWPNGGMREAPAATTPAAAATTSSSARSCPAAFCGDSADQASR